MFANFHRTTPGKIAVAVFGLAACSGTAAGPMQNAGRSVPLVTASAGQEFAIILGTVGPGQYDSIPAISSTSVRFIDAAIVPPYTPAGAHQQFRFEAQSPGIAVITFRHTAVAGVVTDTVVIQ
ncbi:MAG: hypothetical protein ACREL5_05690 [Gemmatimonadales bacterium]